MPTKDRAPLTVLENYRQRARHLANVSDRSKVLKARANVHRLVLAAHAPKAFPHTDWKLLSKDFEELAEDVEQYGIGFKETCENLAIRTKELAELPAGRR